jgi:hypothetical protein
MNAPNLELLQRLISAGVSVSLNPEGGLHLRGRRPPDDLLQAVKAKRDDLIRLLTVPAAFGADLIPRAPRDDARYAGVDLAARAHDRDALDMGIRRRQVAPHELPAGMRIPLDRIASELRAAGVEEIGRYATDVLYAYCDVPNLSPALEAAMYDAWALSIAPDKLEATP